MSSSFRNRAIRGAALAAFAATCAAPVVAADSYFQPLIEVRTEYYSNRDLEPSPSLSVYKQDVLGYVANLSANAGVRTQRSDTRLQPKIQFQEFPDRDDLKRINASLGLQNTYKWERSQWRLIGNFMRQDRSNRQLVDAGYDEFDPDNPVVDGSGKVALTPETITTLQARPGFTHAINQKVEFVFDGLVQTSRRDSDDPARDLDADTWSAQAGFGWNLRPRTRLEAGAYYSSYKASRNLNTTDGTGLAFDLEHEWNPTLRSVFLLDVERTEVQSGVAGSVEKMNSAAASVEVIREGQVGELHFAVGRSFSPTSYGNRSNIDQVRLEMRRRLTPLVQLRTALRGLRSTAQGDLISREDDHKYARADLEMRWNLTRNWYVAGSYSYAWVKYKRDADDGAGHIGLVSFGYQGLAPQWAKPIR
jgi:hypothetical protein